MAYCIVLFFSCCCRRCEREQHLRQGYLLLMLLHFWDHAMFSEIDRPLGADTLEYACLMEIQCGEG